MSAPSIASDQALTRQAASLIANGLDAGSVCMLAAERRVRERVLTRLARRRAALRSDLGVKRLLVSEYAKTAASQLKFWATAFAAATRAGARTLHVVATCPRDPRPGGRLRPGARVRGRV